MFGYSHKWVISGTGTEKIYWLVIFMYMKGVWLFYLFFPKSKCLPFWFTIEYLCFEKYTFVFLKSSDWSSKEAFSERSLFCDSNVILMHILFKLYNHILNTYSNNSKKCLYLETIPTYLGFQKYNLLFYVEF